MSTPALDPPPACADVVEGLIREYLVKQGLQDTLSAFNREQPKHANSISKREVLRAALGLDRAAAKYKKESGGAALPPTLELWVQYQMSKLSNNFVTSPAPAQARPVRPVARQDDSDEEPEVVSMPERPVSASMAGRRSMQASSAAGLAGSASRTDGLMGSSAFGASSGGPVPARGASGLAQRMSALDVGEPDSGSAPERSSYGAMGRTQGRPAMGYGSTTSAFDQGYGSSAASSRGGYGAPAPAPPAAAARPLASTMPAPSSRPAPPQASRQYGGRNELLVEEVDDLDDDLSDPWGGAGAGGMGSGSLGGAGSTRLGSSSGAPGRAMAVARGQPLSPDAARAVRQLLWGNRGQPPPSWQQGFFYCNRPGLQFGLVQKQGGPCGVLAGVQAHCLAALKTPMGFNLSPTASQQQAALAAAIAEVLWQAHMGPSATLALPPRADEAGMMRGMGGGAGGLSYDQLLRGASTLTAGSKEELQELVRANLGAYMEEDGWGIALLLLSLALSRGVSAIQSDMDEPNNALMGMHGYCTQELVNCIITGQAVSNVFDGNRELDGSLLKGVTRRCRLGLLTLFEWYKYVEVGSCLKTPELPVWVVCSESHFTVLFSTDLVRPLRGQAPFELHYYDELANQDAPIRLTITTDPRGGWTARVGDSFGDRGKCEGANIPPLECVIETRWPGVAVDWNGAEPIL